MSAAHREPIAVIGTGYVGLVTAAGFAELGHEVVCVDVDADKVARLQAGEVPIYEPGLAEVLADAGGRIRFSTELAPALEAARLLFVCVGTPPTYSGDADLSAVWSVVEAMPTSDRHALVMKSTVPPGTGNTVKRRLADAGRRLAYVSCPEFLREGSALRDFRDPDRVVVGDDGDWAGDALVALYEPLEAPLVRTDIVSAEMVKLATNAFLSTKISFINEIANVCEETGADVLEVARGMGLDHRVGSAFLRPGIGFGGSCLAGEETVLVRWHGRTTLVTFEELWRRAEARMASVADELIEPDGLDILSWAPEWDEPRFMPVTALTRRWYDGDMVEVRTKMGRRIRCTADHPWIVSEAGREDLVVKLAGDLTVQDSVPLAARTRRWHTAGPPAVFPTVSCPVGPGDPEGRTPSSVALAERRHSAGSCAPVTSVERSHGAELVYSLEVPGTHTFVSSGDLVLHNCFPKDISALKQLAGNSGYHFQLLNAVIEVNELQKRRVVAKLQKHLGELVGRRVALLGLAFKPDTDDMREASSLVLAARLLAEGAQVSAFDPVAAEAAAELMPGVRFAADALDALDGADACVLVTEWDEFLGLDWAAAAERMAGRLVVDGRNALDGQAVREAGFTYEGIGRR